MFLATFLPMSRKLKKELQGFASMSPEKLLEASTKADIELADYNVDPVDYIDTSSNVEN